VHDIAYVEAENPVLVFIAFDSQLVPLSYFILLILCQSSHLLKGVEGNMHASLYGVVSGKEELISLLGVHATDLGEVILDPY
jgi:hypothetical protein